MGLWSSVGGFLNDITGVSSASNRAYNQSTKLSNLSFEQEKYFAQNAHQMEAQDLLKAGYNPALTTGASSAGSIASDGGTGNAGYTGSSAGINPLSIIDAINTTKQTNADTKLKEETAETTKFQGLLNWANAVGKMLENEKYPQKFKAELQKTYAEITKSLKEAGFANEKSLTEMSQRQVNRETAKYMKERARGYTQSESNSFEFGGGNALLNAKGGGSRTRSRTY